MATNDHQNQMRVIIAGGRNQRPSDDQIDAAVKASGFQISTVISGTCRGVDQAGENWAFARGIPVIRFEPDWDRYGKMAGPYRNQDMAVAADGLIAFWDGKSRGTASMIEEAKLRGLRIHVQSPT